MGETLNSTNANFINIEKEVGKFVTFSNAKNGKFFKLARPNSFKIKNLLVPGFNFNI